MSGRIGTVRTIRVFVEPVDVEVDEDDGLAWTSLQTAFPGCSGMFYKGVECKSAVKFDGTKFHPPGGAWNDREYFVTLGQRTQQFPFGSYENASKQFERSVSAVQKMMGIGGGTIHETPRRSHRSKLVPLSSVMSIPNTPQAPHAMTSLGHEAETDLASSFGGRQTPSSPPNVPIHRELRANSSGSEKSDPLPSIQERERLLQSSSTPLSPIEQQFVDLARISTGKDAVINGLREEGEKMKREMERVESELKRVEADLLSYQRRCIAQEEELDLLRRMSTEQTNMCEKVNILTRQVLERDAEIATIRTEFAQKLVESQKRNDELSAKNDSLLGKIDALSNQIHSLDIEKDMFHQENAALLTEIEPLRILNERVGITSVDEANSYSTLVQSEKSLREEIQSVREESEEMRQKTEEVNNLCTSMARENTRLMERNDELEKRMVTFEQDVSAVNEKWKSAVHTKEEDWRVKKSELELDIESQRREVENLQRMLEGITRDAAESGKRASELEQSLNEARKQMTTQEFKTQEPLKRQLFTMRDQLRESQERVKELNQLVMSLSTDARNSQRDVSDFYYGSGTL